MACWMTVIALGLFVWSVLDPDPIPVMVAMSLGQVIGTTASGIFAWIIFDDLRRSNDRGSR